MSDAERREQIWKEVYIILHGDTFEHDLNRISPLDPPWLR